MLDKKERSKVIELFESGTKISDIAKDVGVSRQSVYNVIRDDFEKDPDLHALKKEVKKTELQKKIEELKEPIKTRSELERLNKIVYDLMRYVMLLWERKTKWEPPDCFYCGELLEYHKEESPEGKFIYDEYKCPKCGKVFPFP